MTDRMLKFHPLANAFPLLTSPELGDLSDDIASNGLRFKIVLFDGKILDGRNRYRAARKAHVTLTENDFEDFTGTWTDAMRYVVSLNLVRRHLNESQRAFVAARLADIERPDGADDETVTDTSANLSSQPSMSSPPRPAPVGQDEAAARLNVSRGSVQAAKKVQQKGVEQLGQAVETGKIRVSAAARIADLPPAEQQDIVNGGPVAIRRAASDLLRQKREKATPTTEPAVEPAGQPETAKRQRAAEIEVVKAAVAFSECVEQLVAAQHLVDPVLADDVAGRVRRAAQALEGLAVPA